MSRLLIGAALAALLQSSALAADPSPPSPDPVIAEAFTYAFPVYEEARVRWRAIIAAGPASFNRFEHSRDLAGPGARGVTTPNNDTLYSSAFLDLSAGPVALGTPEFGDRYWSVSFMDAYTNNFATIGRRTTGDAPQRYWLAGPNWHGAAPEGMTLIRAPGAWVWALGRILVDGADDLPKARALQDGLVLQPVVQAAPTPTTRPVDGDAASFLAVVDEALKANPPPPADRAEIARISAVGVGPDAPAPSPAVIAAWTRDLPPLQQRLATTARGLRSGQGVGGWTTPSRGVGQFGTDYGLRASVALAGLAALEPAEAVYLSPLSDQNGEALDSARRYRFHIPRDGLPIDAFWSLSAYHQDPDARLFFADNPIHRYAIGDRTRGLAPNPDGSLDVYVQRDPPADPAIAANWLPLPDGPVRLVLRLYQPRPAVISGAFRPAPLERLP